MLFHVYDAPKPDGYFLYEPTGLYRTLLDADWIIYTLLPILLLIVVGGLYVAETVSVILQVGYFKMTGGKRIFRMAPLHHHFELMGVPESKIIIRFWILSILLALVGLSTLKLR